MIQKKWFRRKYYSKSKILIKFKKIVYLKLLFKSGNKRIKIKRKHLQTVFRTYFYHVLTF